MNETHGNAMRPQGQPFVAFGVAAALMLFLVGTVAAADGIYTAEQAKRGEQIYGRSCAVCHQEDLSGRTSDGGPQLRGGRFTSRWGEMSVKALLTTMEELMPEKHPGSLTRQGYVDVVAFILRSNGLPAGTKEIPIADSDLRNVILHFAK